MDAGDYHGQEEEKERTQIGALLEQRRLERGLSLRDVEQATKIRTRYLEGLEREDYGALPDAVYVQGFLKTYANFLGLDGEQLSREFRERRAPRRIRQLGSYEVPSGPGEFEQPLVTPGALSGAERRRISGTTVLAVSLAVLVLAAVIGALYFIGSRSATGPSGEVGVGGGPETQSDVVAPTEIQPAPVVSGPTTQPATTGATTESTANPLRVTVSVPDTSTGLNVSTDGTLKYSEIAQPGFSQTFEAQNGVTVEARNGGAVQVEVNGRSEGALGSSGQGATRTFTRDSVG